jgi:hypothetical protein
MSILLEFPYCVFAFIALAVFARHLFRVLEDIRNYNPDNAVRYACGRIPFPSLRPNLYLKKDCQEWGGGISR